MTDLSRRSFLKYGIAASVAGPLARSPAPRTQRGSGGEADIEELTIAQLQESMRSGARTSHTICAAYFARIAELDPKLHAVIEKNPDALSIADQLDADRKAGRLRGPLHGIPVLIKDNIATGDKMMTTAGSLALAGMTAPRDASIVGKLRAAGAVIIGKTNLSEWANFRSTHSVSGWSGRGGQCRNPYAIDRNPCGSSSGTGAAISANFAAVGVGTETDGSVVCPSGANSLVGLKPTLGLVSRSGIIPIAHSQDTAGPMCRTVTDAAILLGALAGADPADAATSAAPSTIPDYTKSLDADGLKGARIGVARAAFGSVEGDRIVNAALEVLKAQGAVLVDPVEIPHIKDYGDQEFTVLLYEFKADLNTYLAGLGATNKMKTLWALMRLKAPHKARG